MLNGSVVARQTNVTERLVNRVRDSAVAKAASIFLELRGARRYRIELQDQGDSMKQHRLLACLVSRPSYPACPLCRPAGVGRRSWRRAAGSVAAHRASPSNEIIQKFAAKEKQFKLAREQYTYTQDVTVQTLEGNTVDGQYQQVSDILFDDRGNRIEEVTFAPQSSLQRVIMTQSDYDDIRHRLPFVLTSDEIGKYQILYVGKQKEDELGTYVFDIAPKQIEHGRALFPGPHLGGRSRFPDREDLRRDRAAGAQHEASREGKSVAEVHHLARSRSTASTGSLPTPAPTTRCISPMKTSHALHREVHELQALRCEVEDYL